MVSPDWCPAIPGTRAVSAAHPHVPHWYLIHVGVDPAAQGRGLGARLLAPTLERCDREGTPAYLETARAANLPFYRRLGFEVTAESEIIRGPTIWSMWRAPAAPAR
jgi:ribosomal protein S18 acetylase RimI-like enzyme